MVQLPPVCPQLVGVSIFIPGGNLPFLVSLQEPYPDFTAPYLNKSIANGGEQRIAISTCTPNATLYIAVSLRDHVVAELRVTVITDAMRFFAVPLSDIGSIVEASYDIANGLSYNCSGISLGGDSWGGGNGFYSVYTFGANYPILGHAVTDHNTALLPTLQDVIWEYESIQRCACVCAQLTS